MLSKSHVPRALLLLQGIKLIITEICQSYEISTVTYPAFQLGLIEMLEYQFCNLSIGQKSNILEESFFLLSYNARLRG
ncbi:hypothetical protein DDN79_17570, partial [Vibrio cholerae]|nr:hypothetical protein [Vibrio cholerae]